MAMAEALSSPMSVYYTVHFI